MTRVILAVALGASVSISVILPPLSAFAQDPTDLTFVVTPLRSPLAIQRTGSAVTVLRGEDIARTSRVSIVDALRAVPGLEIYADGGPGGVTSARLRGADSSRTLVLVDGVRVNDPTTPGGQFDFATIPPALIDRIEVLRGPQSALYGSDAVGGVIAIFTKRGEAGPPRFSAQVEGGSYGTAAGNAGVVGSAGALRYAFGVNGQRSDGFSSYGYRIGRLAPYNPPLRSDGLARFGGYGRVGYDPGNGFRLELAGLSSYTEAEYDGFGTEAPNISFRRLHQLTAKAELDSFDGRVTHTLELFGNRVDRSFRTRAYGAGGAILGVARDDFTGDRYGAEYRARIGRDAFGSLILGGRWEEERAKIVGVGPFRAPPSDKRQATRSGFALWQVPIGERFDLSLGGRIDDVDGIETFATWRATAAYRLPETGTTLRTSIGTGAKAPTLYQRFSIYGTPGLLPEKSLGIDAGIDQTLFAGRANLSLTGFYNRFDNLIGFNNATFRFFNTTSAETAGIEAALDADIADWLRARASYTYLHTKDLATKDPLPGRPEHMAKFSLVIEPVAQWTIEPSVTLVSERYQSPTTKPLAPWAKLDIHTAYRVNAGLELYARAENLTDTRYEVARGFGTAGRAVYVGLRSNW